MIIHYSVISWGLKNDYINLCHLPGFIWKKGMPDVRTSEFRSPQVALATQKAKAPLCPNVLKRSAPLQFLCWRRVVGKIVFSPMRINAHLRKKAPNSPLLGTPAPGCFST